MSDKQDQTFEQVADEFYPKEQAEPLEVPTAEAEGDKDPVDEVIETAKDAEDEASDKGESEDESDDTLIYDINGKEYTAEDIKKLESGNLMQADYTNKTKALAKDREELDGNTALLSDAITKTNDLSAQLEILVGEDKEINWAELEKDDPTEYIKLKKRADSRESLLAKAKAEMTTKPVDNVDYEAERVKLVEANPLWLKDGKPTDEYKSDMDAITNFYKDNNWSQEQIKLASKSWVIIQLVIDEAKRKSASKVTDEKTTKARKKIIATPRSGKAVAKQQQNLQPHEIMYGADKRG